MAAYGAQRRAGKTDKQAIQYLYKFFRHVPVQPDSARAALQIFAQGKGDVLLTYENEAIYAEKKGVHTQYKTPKATLLIETPVALTKAGLKKPAAKAFYKYLWSSTAQKAFAAQGYRPVVKSVAKGYKFYKPAGLFTINTTKLGLNGWTKVNRRFFHPQKGIVAKIEKSLGH
jgi:sulfate transport system substrate-binding protein